jgi:hypothetical protein
MTKNILNYYSKSILTQNFLNNFLENKHIGLFEPGTNNVYKKDGKDLSQTHTLDDINKYSINSYGLRGKEINSEIDILAVGCSFTFGVGVPDNGTWSSFLEEKTNKNVLNFGFTGYSIPFLSKKIIEFCSNYSKPKKIYCLFPELFRMMFVVDPDNYNVKKINNNQSLFLQSFHPKIEINQKSEMSFKFDTFDEFTKMNNGTSPHGGIFESIMHIRMLENFCKINKIELVWTTWCEPSSIILEKLGEDKNFILKKYVSIKNYHLNMFGFGGDFFNLCNLDHKEIDKQHPSYFSGTDYYLKDGKVFNSLSHPGMHYQYHIADFFSQF